MSAQVRVYVAYGSVDGPGIYSTSSLWTERGLTWNNRPARLQTALADVGPIGAGTWIEYDVSSVVTGDGTYSFALAQVSWDSTGVNSREAAVNRPHLVINTTAGAEAIRDSFSMRRTALMRGLPYFTTLSGARAAVGATLSIRSITSPARRRVMSSR